MNFNFFKNKNFFGISKAEDTSHDFFQTEHNLIPGQIPDEVIIQTEESPLKHYVPQPADPEKAKKYFAISRWALYVGVFLAPLLFLSGNLPAGRQVWTSYLRRIKYK